MTLQQQNDILDHTYALLTAFNNGVPPKGSVAPWWETSAEGTALLLDKGIEYGACGKRQRFRYRRAVFSLFAADHSHMAHE